VDAIYKIHQNQGCLRWIRVLRKSNRVADALSLDSTARIFVSPVLLEDVSYISFPGYF